MKFRALLLIVELLHIATAYCQYEPHSTGERVAHTYYTLDYNEDHEQANWVYYTLTPNDLIGSESRNDSFKADPKVNSGSATLADYTKSGFDRGHLAPAGDMTRSSKAMRESFYLSNMSPQAPSFNRGIWRTCESYVRGLATDSIYIVTGPIFKNNIGAIGTNNVTIPGAYYKIAYRPSQNEIVAFIIQNKKGKKELHEYRVTVDEVEEVTGIDFFYQLPDKLEKELESKK